MRPLKYLRLGYTECTLMFIYFIETQHKELLTPLMLGLKERMIKWLYTTSGYYDKKITCGYMNARHIDTDPEVYKKYFSILLSFIKGADAFRVCVHYCKTSDEVMLMLNELQVVKEYNTYNDFFNFTKNKSVLIISSFSELFREQYVSGNCAQINGRFKEIKNILFYTSLYTFFNNGPHEDILETEKYMYDDIMETIPDEYDTVVISCGAYSNLLAKRFFENNKNVLTIGGDLQYIFGVLNNRTRTECMLAKKDLTYYVTEIPDKYKPDGYMKIEQGCYW